MSDPLDIDIDLDPTMPLVAAWNAFVPRLPIEILPIEIRRRLVAVYKDLNVQYPDEWVRQQLHGKTVGEVLRRFENIATPQPIASGETDGVKWTLYDPPGTADPK
jgi:hypothetical protein